MASHHDYGIDCEHWRGGTPDDLPGAVSCACKHWDRHECYAARHPERQTYEDECCECVCHGDYGEDTA